MSWLGVAGALIISAVLFSILWLVLPDIHGKAGGYIIFGVIGLVGLVFSNLVEKQVYRVESCTRCDFKQTTKIDSENEVLPK